MELNGKESKIKVCNRSVFNFQEANAVVQRTNLRTSVNVLLFDFTNVFFKSIHFQLLIYLAVSSSNFQ